MRWVDSIGWNGSNYQITTVNMQGDTEYRPVSALHDLDFTRSDTRRMRVVTNFETWKQVSPKEYLRGMGFPNEVGIDRHAVYEFEVSGTIFMVPAIVLMKGLFRPLRGMAQHLFRPQGLENIVIASPQGAQLPVGFYCSPRIDVGIIPERSKSLLEALSWMYCFPSARRMWDSVLLRAKAGQLGVDLPYAQATLVLQTVAYAGKWLVTQLTVVAVESKEHPYEFAIGHTQFIEFHRVIPMESYGRNKPPKQLLTLLSRNGSWHLSDSEWLLVECIVSSRKLFKHSLRNIVDCILEKFGQGIAWKNVAYGTMNMPVVVAAYQRMLKDGRWNALLDALQQLRTPVTTS